MKWTVSEFAKARLVLDTTKHNMHFRCTLRQETYSISTLLSRCVRSARRFRRRGARRLADRISNWVLVHRFRFQSHGTTSRRIIFYFSLLFSIRNATPAQKAHGGLRGAQEKFPAARVARFAPRVPRFAVRPSRMAFRVSSYGAAAPAAARGGEGF